MLFKRRGDGDTSSGKSTEKRSISKPDNDPSSSVLHFFCPALHFCDNIRRGEGGGGNFLSNKRTMLEVLILAMVDCRRVSLIEWRHPRRQASRCFFPLLYGKEYRYRKSGLGACVAYAGRSEIVSARIRTALVSHHSLFFRTSRAVNSHPSFQSSRVSG